MILHLSLNRSYLQIHSSHLKDPTPLTPDETREAYENIYDCTQGESSLISILISFLEALSSSLLIPSSVCAIHRHSEAATQTPSRPSETPRKRNRIANKTSPSLGTQSISFKRGREHTSQSTSGKTGQNTQDIHHPAIACHCHPAPPNSRNFCSFFPL